MSDPLQLEERDFLLRSLDDLDREFAAGDVTIDDYEELRRGYVGRAAALQRAIDAESVVATAPSRWRRAAIVLAGAALAAVLLGWLLARASGERFDADSPTGGVPESINSMLTEARTMTGEGRLDDATKRYIDVLRLDPDNAEARTYKGWLLIQLGSTNNVPEFIADGTADLDQAIVADPTYPDARVFRGIVAFRIEDDAKRAVDEFNVLFSLPDVPTAQLTMVLPVETEARAELGLPARELAPGGLAPTDSSAPAPSTTAAPPTSG
jgi:tetratricopeptide (TPR) repeat protein